MNKYHIIALVGVLLIAGALLLSSGESSDTSERVLTPEEMQGIHIMPDGAVMTPTGAILEDAVVLEDGRIRLGDGQVIEPSNDFRKK